MRRPVVHVVAGESLDAEAPPIYLSIYIYPHAPLLVRFPVRVLIGRLGRGGGVSVVHYAEDCWGPKVH